MKQILLCLIAVLLSTAVVLAQPGKSNEPKMEFEKTSIDFGSVKQGTPVIAEFRFTNKGAEPLVISNVSGSSGSVAASYPKEPIYPGKTGVIKVTLRTSDINRKITRSITVNSNSINGTVVLTLTGNVEAANREPQIQ